MDDIVNLPFGEGNEIYLSEISINKEVSDAEYKEKGDLIYRLQYYSNGFSVDAKVRDGTGNIYRFIENLKNMYTNLSGTASWDNSYFTIFTEKFVIFEFNFKIQDTGRVNFDSDVEYKDTQLKHKRYIDQSYLPIWIKELEKIFNQ